MEKDERSSVKLTEQSLGENGHRSRRIELTGVGEGDGGNGKLERGEALEGEWRAAGA